MTEQAAQRTACVLCECNCGITVATVEVSPTMQAGHIALPDGMGVDFTTPDGAVTTGSAPNELTSATWKDSFAGTPWHKHIPARLEPIRH
ncbi:hypothetical protein DMB66_50810 [Actinoplanes sp. ATCC 53533]|uniref:hypothetical protein n=1 Tax=Actinoplanes sp. ATCC 53533 TaxID=1288362 RepID=UPI000F7B179D|nr:hypothetical protein [Actinoplanes sp. ATCC 53533]RSM45617.1 hypothetical protein DMB66_50810 [Actinoplanes sp. ATCC 53533]